MSKYDATAYERPSVAVDLLIFTIEDERLKCLMIRRKEEPFADMLALPGVFVGIEETLEEAAQRGIREEAGLENIYFEQLYTFGGVRRDPRMRVISVSYMALVDRGMLAFKAGERTTQACLVDVEELLHAEGEEQIPVAFDHKDIIGYARWRLQNKVEYTSIAFHLVPEEFTLPELQKVYEILLGKNLYKANFRKKISDRIEETGKMTEGDAHRPSKLYRLKKSEDE